MNLETPTLFNLAEFTISRQGPAYVFTPKPPKPPQPIPELCSTAQAAKFLHIAQDTVKMLCLQGAIPARKKTLAKRGPWVIERKALIAYRNARHAQTSNAA